MILAGKRVLVTGASRGIGRAIAELFAREGASLVVSARTAEPLAELAERITGAGGKAWAVPADLDQEAAAKALILKTREHLGGLDVLVNNAGILLPGKVGMIQLDDAKAMISTNVLAVLNLTQYGIRLMPKTGGGAVINVASIAGTQGMDGLAAYSASKAAVLGFTRAAAKELAAQGIRVNAIAPGFIDTDIARGLDADRFAKRVASVRLGRIGQPLDVANCALFLASDLASYVTGQTIGVDGGMQV